MDHEEISRFLNLVDLEGHLHTSVEVGLFENIKHLILRLEEMQDGVVGQDLTMNEIHDFAPVIREFLDALALYQLHILGGVHD